MYTFIFDNNIDSIPFYFLDHLERFGSWQELENGKVHMFHFVVLRWLSVFYFGHDSNIFN